MTGHTGFKGSWLSLWLAELAADVVGLALSPPTSPNHWDLIKLSVPENRVDVRDASAVAQVVQKARPELVFHLAAQSLVRRSYREPLESWSTNVMGTANLLEACRQADSVRAIVVVTSDKCYENLEQKRGYREDDRLSGHDPYSASKSATELVVSSYRSAFFNRANSPLIATARAGNVVGGGDWSEDRLVPDLIRAVASGSDLEIRSPDAVRPWQHVLESLSGYLLLGQRLLQGDPRTRTRVEFWAGGRGPPQDCRRVDTDACVLAEPSMECRADSASLRNAVALPGQQQSARKTQLATRLVARPDDSGNGGVVPRFSGVGSRGKSRTTPTIH